MLNISHPFKMQFPGPQDTSPTDEPPLSIGNVMRLSREHPQSPTCKEYPAFRRILGTHSPQKASHKSSPLRQTRQRRPRRQRTWQEDARSLAADSNVVLPSDGVGRMIETATTTTNRRMPRLVRQDAFRAASTSRDWRSFDYIDDDDELYRLGLLYDESRDLRREMNHSSIHWDDDLVQSARFDLNAISHSEPTYTVRVTGRANRGGRNGGHARHPHGDDDEDISDHDSDHDGDLTQVRPALTLDLSFTALTENIHRAWPRRGCQDTLMGGTAGGNTEDDRSQDSGYASQATATNSCSSQEPTQHIIYELYEQIPEEHDEDDDAYLRCPGTPITQHPEPVSDDEEDVCDRDADWFGLMEDGWTPIDEEAKELLNANNTHTAQIHAQEISDGGKAGDAWVLLGSGGQDCS